MTVFVETNFDIKRNCLDDDDNRPNNITKIFSQYFCQCLLLSSPYSSLSHFIQNDIPDDRSTVFSGI